jgi:hypothetical protein
MSRMNELQRDERASNKQHTITCLADLRASAGAFKSIKEVRKE